MGSSRPFDGFRSAIDDPRYFFGREDILGRIESRPLRVRMLLGGRRIGKTSTLRAIEWHLVKRAREGGSQRVLPVFISFQIHQPTNLDHFLFIMVDELRRAMDRWHNAYGAEWRELYRSFLNQITAVDLTLGFLKLRLDNPNPGERVSTREFRELLAHSVGELQESGFGGVCFLFDEAEYVVRQNWADNAWGFLRGIKDTDRALGPAFGLVVSGYRDVKRYRQKVGSPLAGIAEEVWLSPLLASQPVDQGAGERPDPAGELIRVRSRDESMSLDQSEKERVLEWSGRHPYLLNRVLNEIFDERRRSGGAPLDDLLNASVQKFRGEFESWWNEDGKSDGFGHEERAVYAVLQECRRSNPESIAAASGLSENDVRNALDILFCTGIIDWRSDVDEAEIGAPMFEAWVRSSTVGSTTA